jgi:lipopolysaccharide/colanic/teichoic acid biosynthesis glycosyltransferase
MKRFFDVIASSLLLLLLWPIIVLVAIAVRIALGSPVFFVQERPGLHERPFRMIKFRTMGPTRDRSGRTLSDSERLSPFGRVLRTSSFDELPELLNVLVGQMSLVGPRPLLPEYLILYSDRQRRRHEVRPGITGWAQVNGRNTLGWADRLELDVWYVENKTFLLDCQILFMTLVQVARAHGIAENGAVTMTKFSGESLNDNERRGGKSA